MSEKVTHESFGLVSLSHPIGNFDNLFQSGVTSNRAVTLSISRACVVQHEDVDPGIDHVFADKHLIEVTLSPLQFAELLTSQGMGDGVPCTIEWAEGRAQLDPPKHEQATTRTVGRFADKCQELSAFSKQAGKIVDEVLAKGGKMKAADRDKLREVFGKLTSVATSTGPFLMSQAENHLRRLTAEAKTTIDSHAHARALSVGVPVAEIAAGIVDVGDSVPVVPEESEPDLPDLPDLPPTELSTKAVEDMTARDLGLCINSHVQRLYREHRKECEAYWVEHRTHKPMEVGKPFHPWASGERGKIIVTWVSYHGPSTLSLEQARAYLTALRKGHTGSPHQSIKGES